MPAPDWGEGIPAGKRDGVEGAPQREGKGLEMKEAAEEEEAGSSAPGLEPQGAGDHAAPSFWVRVRQKEGDQSKLTRAPYPFLPKGWSLSIENWILFCSS